MPSLVGSEMCIRDRNYVREKHWHRSIEMFVVLEGKLDFYINEEDIHLDKKTFVIVNSNEPVSYTHLRAHETRHDLVCRLLLEKKNSHFCLLYTPPRPVS